jgi:hypothetical protein
MLFLLAGGGVFDGFPPKFGARDTSFRHFHVLSLSVFFPRAMHSSSSISSLGLGSVVQYTFLAVVAYILAGAPLLSILKTNADSSSSVKARDGSVDAGKLDSLVIPEKNLTCDEHAYKGVYVLSREPLVVYIEGFLGHGEGEEVVKLRYVIKIVIAT